MIIFCLLAAAALEACDPSSSTDAATLGHALNTTGFALLRGFFTAEAAAAAMEALQARRHESIHVRRSERIPAVLELDAVFGALLDGVLGDSGLVGAIEELIGPDFTLGSYHALLLHAERDATTAAERDEALRQNLHSDYPYGHATPFHGGRLSQVLPQWPHTLQLLWMLTEFNETNGAILLTT